MVSELIEAHAADWDVYLPAKVFSLCFEEHPRTKERPFSVLCCKGVEPVQFPRELDVSVHYEHLSLNKALLYTLQNIFLTSLFHSFHFPRSERALSWLDKSPFDEFR